MARSLEFQVGPDGRIRVTAAQAVRIVWPHARSKFLEQVRACLPIGAYLAIFQLAVLRRPIDEWLPISIGIFLVLLGLALFMEGLRLGLMPFGETIGNTLPRKSGVFGIIVFAFLVGIGATLAEPAIGVLKDAGARVSPEQAPLLFALLNRHTGLLVGAVGLGVGIAATLGMLRLLRSWRLAAVALPVLVATLILTLVAREIDALRPVIGLAWDCGAVTTGPVTVPLVLALGMGLSRALGQSDSGLSGFGVVTLASLFPILMVLLLAFFLFAADAQTTPVERETAPATSPRTGRSPGPGSAREALSQADVGPVAVAPEAGSVWISKCLVAVSSALQAIVPLVAFLYLFQVLFLREPIRHQAEIVLGMGFCLLGMGIFNVGLGLGLSALGGQVGQNLPVAFMPPEALYGPTGGKLLALVFAFLLGYGATLAEPALNALGMTVEEVTQGAFRKGLLVHAVAFGVGAGIALGVAMILWSLPLALLLGIPYVALIPITLASSERFATIGWDSAGVTTGPVTVPLVLAMGLGIGTSTGALDGFGILAMASVCPILSVLLLGLLVEARLRRSEESVREEAAAPGTT